MERDRRPSTRLSGFARRFLYLTVLCTAATGWLGAGIARADVPPLNDGAPPSISGVAQQGDILTADPGGWSGDAPITFTYAWSDGQTGQAITLTAADVGQSLTVTVTGTNDFGEASATSDGYGPVLPDPPTPGNTPPGITGNPQQGDTLTVSNGDWSNSPTSFAYAWEDCSGANCTTITGANSSSYTLQSSDVGSTIVASVTASNAGGPGSATTGAVGPVLPLAPTIGNTLPSIGGVPQQGNTLSVSNGSWNNNPTGFAYVWEDCDSSGNNCVPIPGATANTYTLQSTDAGIKVVAQVTASNAGGQNSATSAAVGPVLPLAPTIGNTLPSIGGGTPQQGNTLSVGNGSWNNSPTGFAYVWEDCDGSGSNCVPIAGAASSTYKLKAADVGGTIVAQVTASNAGGQNSAMSAAVGPVLPPAPTIGATKPSIAGGTPQQGNTLSVSNGTWNNTPTGFAYVWEDCNASGGNCVPISGATSSAYTLQPSDVGSKIVAQVTASNAGGQNSATSAAVGPVLPAAPTIGTAPGITGAAQQGHTLTVSNGTWGNSPIRFAYAWQDCDSTGNNCTSIGTSSSTYTLLSSDVGKYVSVTVTASNSGGQTPVTTASVGPVLPPAPANTQLPGITKTGGTLSVSNGNWNNNPTTFSYSWESCKPAGTNCAAISGATSASYALSAADIGTTIACVVTATGAGGSTSVTTAKTAVVAASDIQPASQPTTTGLLATPNAPVTNQDVTLIATVTAGTSSTALWGTVTFEKGGAAIGGCASMPAVPSGRSATVACSTSFPASTPQLTAVFTPASGSILKGSSSPGTSFAIGPDTSSTTLTAASSVNVGASTTYTAAVVPGSQSGPVQPGGSVEFLDGSTPIDSCGSQTLLAGLAMCTVSYAAAGTHEISAVYSGDGNFSGSSSQAAQVSAAAVPTPVIGAVTATMQWAFYFTPKYTLVRNLLVNGVSSGASVVVRCQGHGCPFTTRATVLTKGKRCGRKAKRSCPTPGTLSLTSSFAGRHLAVGARITVSITRPNWVGKSYTFTVRPRRGPRVQIGSLPAG